MDKHDDPNFVFTYDETSPSCLRWRNPRKKGVARKGEPVGTLNKLNSMWHVQFRGAPRPVHRIVWEMHKGEFDSRDTIHFRNENMSDPRIDNLYCMPYKDKNPQAQDLADMNWRECFDYKDGHLYWKDNHWSGRTYNRLVAAKGDPLYVLEDKDGYYRAKAGNTGQRKSMHLVHRMIYEWHYGKIPDGMQIDHINGYNQDNRIENLRLASQEMNARNRKLASNNKTGVTGVMIKGTSYVAMWRENGSQVDKSFSWNKYGKEKAFELACKTREEAIRKLNEQYGDEAYTEDHGERVLD